MKSSTYSFTKEQYLTLLIAKNNEELFLYFIDLAKHRIRHSQFRVNCKEVREDMISEAALACFEKRHQFLKVKFNKYPNVYFLDVISREFNKVLLTLSNSYQPKSVLLKNAKHSIARKILKEINVENSINY